MEVPKLFIQYFSRRFLHFSSRQSVIRVGCFYNSRFFLANETSRYTKNIINWNFYSPQRLSTFTKKNVQADDTETNPLNINTNVTNNVMLYRYERPYLFKFGVAFAVFALVGSWSMVDNVYSVLCSDLFNSSNSWTTNIINHFLPLVFIVTGFIGGPLIGFMVWYVTVRSVKYIVLHKGGKKVTFVTNHPFKSEVNVTAPLEDVSSQDSRGAGKSYLSVKVKRYKRLLFVEKSGHFVNPNLFDCTIAVDRRKSYIVNPKDVDSYIRQL